MPSLLPNDIDDPIAEQYRSQLDASGQDTRFLTNREIVQRLGDNILSGGRTNEDIVATYGEGFLSNYLDQKNAPVAGQGVFGDGMASLRRQALGLGGSALGGIGLAADAMPGELFDPVRDAAMKKAAELSQSASEGPQPTIDNYADVRMDKPMEVLRYGANLVGGALPSVAESALAFGGGGVVGLAGKGILKKKLKKAIGEATEQEIERLARKKAFSMGAAAGLGTSSALLGTGEVYSQLYPYTQLDPSDEEYIDPDTVRNVSFAGGALVAGLDFVSAGKMLNKILNIGDEVAESYITRLIRNLPEGVFLEGATEGAQEFVIMASEKYARGENMYEFTGQEIEQMINAGIMGAAGGSQFAMFSAIPGPKTPPRDVDDSDTPKIDMSQRPDTETLLADQPGETLGFEIGQEVSEPFGVSGKIEEIKNGMATVRSTRQDADGVEITKIKQVPTSHLAPVFEKEVKEDTPKDTKVNDIAKLPADQKNKKSKEGGLAPEARPEVGSEVFEPPQDTYSSDVNAENVKKVSKVDRDNAMSVYSELSAAMENANSKVRQGDTYNASGLFKGLLRDGLISQGTYDKVFSNDREALKILRSSGLLGDNYNWKKKTAYDNKLDEDKAKYKEQKKANTRNKRIEDKGYEVNEDEPQVLKKSGSTNFYVIRDIVSDPSNPEDDGYIKVDEFADKELENSVATNLLIDPSLLLRPIAQRTIEPGDKTPRISEYEELNTELKIPVDADFSKGVKFTFYSEKTGKKLDRGKAVKATDIEELSKQIAANPKLLADLKKYPSHATIETTQGVSAEVRIEVSELTKGGESVQLIIGDNEIDLNAIPLDVFTHTNKLPDDLLIDYVHFDDSLDYLLEKEGLDSEIVAKGVTEFSGRTHGKSFAVYKREDDAGLPADSFRIASTKKNASRMSSFDKLKKNGKGAFVDSDKFGDGSYKLVGFITTATDQRYAEKIDVYYEDAEALKSDLMRGGYIEKELSNEGIPQHVEVSAPEAGLKATRNLTINYTSTLRELRQRERAIAIEQPDLDYAEVAAKYDLESDTLKDGEDKEHKELFQKLVKQQSDIAKLSALESSAGKAIDASLTFAKQNTWALYGALERFPKFVQLMDIIERSMRYNNLKSRKNKKEGLTEEDKEFFALHDTDEVFGGKNLTDILNDFVFTNENDRIELHSALSPVISNTAFGSINRPVAEKLRDVYINEHTLYEGAAIKEDSPEAIDAARTDPNALLQLLKYYFIKSGINELEAGRLIKSGMNAATGDIAREAQLRSQGRNSEARSKEVIDSDLYFNPEEIYKAAPMPSIPANAIKENVIASRNKRIAKAFKLLDKAIPGGEYKDLMLEIFKPKDSGQSAFLNSEDAKTSMEDLAQISNTYKADGRYEFQSTIPNQPDLTDGVIRPARRLPETKEDIDGDAILSAQSETAIIAPEQNPIGKVSPHLVTLAQGAIDRFTKGGDSAGSFSGKLALQKVISDVKPTHQNGDALTFWGSMLRGSSSLDNIRIKFMPWAEFRKHARVTEHGVTAGVYRPNANEILITDTFYVDEKITSDEALANLIVHEMTHVPVRLGMEVAYAHEKKDKVMLKELAGMNLGVDNDALVRIYNDVKNVIIPHLHEVNKEHGINPREYALTSVEEFFAELSSNYEFRHLLKKARMTPELSKKLGMSSRNPFKTIWQWIRRIIARVVGVEPNLLDTADNYLKSVIKNAQPMGKYMGSLPFDDSYRRQQALFDFDQKVEEAPSDLPTFWGLFKINKNSKTVYREVADKLISPGNEYLDGDTAYQYSDKLGLNRKKLYAEMQSAHKRYWAKTRRGYRYSEVNWRTVPVGPTNSEVSLEVIKDHKDEIFSNYLEAFEEDTFAEDVSRVINDKPEDGMDRASIKVLDPSLKGLLRALEKEDWLGFDYPSGSIVALFEDEFFENFDVSPNTKSAITRYVNRTHPDASEALGLVQEEDRGDLMFRIEPPAGLSGDGFLKDHKFHVTLTENLAKIEEDGITSGHPSNWLMAGSGKQYGEGSVFAMDNYFDAIKWASEMEWARYSSMGKGAISIITFKDKLDGDAQFPWSEDNEDVISTAGNEGTWYKRKERIRTGQILGYTKLDMEHIKSASIRKRKLMEDQNRYSQVQPPRKFPNTDPDAGARVYHEASAAANNEIVRELTKVYANLGEALPDQFKGDDGLKEFIKNFSSKLNERQDHYSKLLGMEREDVDKLSVGDQGMNRRGRDRAMIDAVKYLSNLRLQARKKKASIGESIDQAKADLAALDRLHKRMRDGKLTAPVELAEALTNKILGELHVPSMQKLFKEMGLDGTEVTVGELKSVRERSDLQAKVAKSMDAIIEMSDTVETLTKKQIVERIENSLDPRLDFLRENKFALHAFASKAKSSVDLFALLRIAKDTDSDRKKSFMRDVANITGAKSEKEADKAYDSADTKGRLGTHLKQLRDLKKKALKIDKNYITNVKEKQMHEAIDGEIMARETRLRTALGELEPVDIRHGVNMKVMRRKRDKDGNIITIGSLKDLWELNDYRIRYSGGKLDDRDGFVKANVETLEFLKDEKAKEEFGQEPWYDIMREQANRAFHQPVGDQYFTIRKQAWMAGIESLNARLNRLGYEGKKLAGMLSRTSALFRDINSDTQYYAKRWNVAYLNLMDKMGINGKTMFTTFYQDLWSYMDNHPEFDGNEEEAVNGAWAHLKEYANVSDKSRLNAETKNAMVTLLRRTIEARDFEADYNFNKLGNRIKDDFKVESLINGEMVDFYRRPVELGYATIPRVLNDAAITDAMYILKKPTNEGQVQFTGKWAPSRSTEDSTYKQLKEGHKTGTIDIDGLRKGMAQLFTDDAVDKWVNNYLKSDTRKTIFKGPDSMEVGNSFVNAIWAESKREATGSASFFTFLDKMYDHYRNNGMLKGETVTTTGNELTETELATREDWYFSMTDQFQKKFDDMHRSYIEILRQNSGNQVHNMLMNSPRSLDSRQLASVLPKEYFYYDSYDEVTSAVRLQMMIATSVFGRGGTNANALRGKADERYTHDAELFKSLIAGATGARPQGIQSDYSKEIRKKVYQALQGRKDITQGRTPEQAFEDLFASAAAKGEMDVIFDHLNKYYGSANVAGPFRDANLPLELLGLQSISVLNNPKSSFWQGLSLTEFPMAFHGMNGMALKATGKGFMTFIDQTFGGMLEAMGMNIGQTHRYADYLANTHFRNSEADLTYKEYTSQVGSGGELAQFGMDSMGAKRGVRFMKDMMMHNRKDKKKGSRAPIDWTTPLIGLFPYINSNINHGAGVGAIFAVESEVLKLAKVIEDQGLQNYHNFSAEELGLGKGGLEFFIGEKDGYNQMNNLLEGNGLPNLSRMAFDFVQRKKQDPNTPVIEKDSGLMINQIAMNEVTGEGFNAKPAALYTNPLWKYFGIFLGWPLWKMARDNRVIQGNSNYVFGKDARTDRATWMAFLKYLSMVSAVYAPAGLAFAMLVDWYDDEVLEKPNNLPPISPWAALPVLGPFMAAQNDPNFSIYAITSRLAKAGVPYGMGMDLANSVFSKGDPYGSAREFTLDSRIFAWSMLKNVYDAMGNWMHQGEIDYQNVTRPIMYGLGGNSVIQFLDATTAMLDIDSTERRMADYIGSRNIIKKYAWGMGLDLRPPGKGYGRPTATSINVRQMERAAYNFDTREFRLQYQEALEAARENGEANPEKTIRDKFKRRLILYNITDGKITDKQLERMFELMQPRERELIQRYLNAHEQFLQMIELQKPMTKKDRAALDFASGNPDFQRSYQRKDPRLFALGYY